MANTGERKDVWAIGEAYELYVGRWSRPVACEFLDWLALPSGRDWIDVGCGTGALSRTILDRAAPSSLAAVDPSEGFLAEARRRVKDPRAAFHVGDARKLPVGDTVADAAVAGLVINFVPDRAAAIAEMRRATRPGGTVAAYVWDYAGEMQMMRRFWDAAVSLDPAAQALDEGRRFPDCRPDRLVELWRAAGLADAEARAIDIPTVFADFDDFWRPFLGGQGPAPGYCMSLDEARRAALREHIRANLPMAEDGTIPLIARAWAVRGTVRHP
ncbi:MAG: methyltransferase domain-containing protein [Alphaproteobacteria bacterium]|nr:methyltransferase domain-containing protein [Alphaproteobacteria bacterium]